MAATATASIAGRTTAKDTGKEIPNPDMENVEFRRYQHWADRRMESLIQRMQTRLKGIKPEVALVTWTTNAGRWGHFLSIPRNMPARMNLLLDAPDQELWLDETNRGNTIAPAFGCAYAWSVTNHRVAFSEPYLMAHGNPYGKDGFPPEELHRRMMLVLTYGGFPSIAVGQPGRLQQAVYDTVREVNRLKPWLIDKQPDRWAAVVMSDNTKTFYGRQAGRVEERYLSNVLGTFRAAVEEHLPVTVINDWNLNERDLAAYKVLVLPNTACMDEAQVAAVTKFVESGGGLVASVDASCFDEFGEPRADFALGRVLGVTRNGVATKAEAGGKPAAEQIDENFAKSIGPDYWEKRKNVFDFRLDAQSVLQTARLADALGAGPVTFKGQAAFVRTDAPDAKAGATITVRDKAGSLPTPAIVTRTFGKGRVVYFAAGVDSAYYLYPYPYQRMLLTSAIRWAAGGECPVSVEGADVRPRDVLPPGAGREASPGRAAFQRHQHGGQPRAAERRRAAAGGNSAGPRYRGDVPRGEGHECVRRARAQEAGPAPRGRRRGHRRPAAAGGSQFDRAGPCRVTECETASERPEDYFPTCTPNPASIGLITPTGLTSATRTRSWWTS